MRPGGSDETALIRDVDKSQAEALGNQGFCEESLLLETAAVSVTAPTEQTAPTLDHDEALWHMGHQLHVKMSWTQSSQCLFRLAVPF